MNCGKCFVIRNQYCESCLGRVHRLQHESPTYDMKVICEHEKKPMQYICDPEWIKCSDRMPEENERILFYWPEGDSKMPCFVFGFFDGKDFSTEDRKLLVLGHEATHWLRIPPLPKD